MCPGELVILDALDPCVMVAVQGDADDLESQSWSRSRETPMISNPSLWYLLYIFTRVGLKLRQGPHQLAQKSIMVTLPLG